MRIFPRSIPLAVQLVCVLVGLVLVTTLTLAVFAYRSSVDSLETSARTSVRTAATNRADGIARMLALRLRNAEGLLGSALSLCGEPIGAERVALSEDCVQPMVQELRRSERAIGMELRSDNRVVTRAGQRVSRGATAVERRGARVRAAGRHRGVPDALGRGRSLTGRGLRLR